MQNKNGDTLSIDKNNFMAKILFPFNNAYADGTKKESDSEIIETLEKNLQSNGMNVRFIPYYEYIDTIGVKKSYSEVIKESVAAGSIDAFCVPENSLQTEGKEPC